MAELKQGCTLKSGKYKIVKTLGQGSFGITYLATTRISMDGQLGKMDVNVNVTIKEFFMSDLNSRATDGTSVERTSSTLVMNYLNKFQREAENLSKLHHPNIVKVLEVFDENNTTYYVMEFIDGETIDEYIKRNGKLTVDESLIITQEVCSALSYMHDHKMLHLDLKPKNIMRDTEGHIYLIDFGLAKQYNDNGEPESSTTLGLGTPGYAPIEQAHYKKDGTFPVTLDIYAVGASLYKMLTGTTPPESSYVLNDGLPHDALKTASVNDDVIAVVEKAMAPIKKDRYQTVTDLSKAISSLLSIEEEEEGTTIDMDSVKKGKVEIDPNTDEIGFHFLGSSYPGSRSYETHITEDSLSLKISCYGNILHEEDFPFNKSRFSKLIEIINNLDIREIPEFDEGADGGETLTLKLLRNGAEYYSGYIYGSEYKHFGGTTDANLYLVKSEIEKCIPNFQALLAKEKDEEPEYEFEDEEPSFLEKYWKYGLAATAVVLCIYFCSNWNSSSSTLEDDGEIGTDTLLVDSVAADSAAVYEEAVKKAEEAAKKAKEAAERAEKDKKAKEEVRLKQKEITQAANATSTQIKSNPIKESKESVKPAAKSESPAVTVESAKVYDVVEEMPSFPGGPAKLFEYLSQNIHYPLVAEENGVQGRVIVTFVVERDGSITDVRVVKSVDPSLDAEAKRVIRSMPRWKPGKQNGSAVRVKYTTPVTFRLQ